jgi:hypothetical protein
MDYNDLISGLKSSQVEDYQPDPVLTEKVNDYAVFGKSFLGGTGGMLEGEAIKKTFKALSKKGSEGLLKQLDLSDEDMEDLVSKVASGDTEGVAKIVAERGINVARNKIGAFVRDTKGSARRLYQSLKAKATGRDAPPTEEEAGEPASASEIAEAPQVAKLPFPESAPDLPDFVFTRPKSLAVAEKFAGPEPSIGGGAPLVPQEDGGFRIGQPPEAYAKPDTELTDQGDMVNNTMKTSGSQREAVEEDSLAGQGEGGGDAGAEVSSIGSKVEKGIDELAVDSEAFDETPIGIGVTALLGVASLVGGIFIKTHKDKFTRPPLPHQMVSSFAVEKGAF